MDKHTQLENLFNKARIQPVEASFGETKEQFLNATQGISPASAVKKVQFLTLKKWIIMLVTLNTIALLFLYTTSTENTTENTSAVKSNGIIETKINVPEKPESEKKNELNASIFVSTENVPHQGSSKLSEKPGSKYVPIQESIAIEKESTKNPEPEINYPNDEYPFPKLTEEEIEANHKEKKKMLKALAKFDKKTYAYIPSGTFEYNGKQFSVQAFYMQKTEVTNLQYRTFLFDLLIQGRKEEFKQAAPDQTLWVKILGESMYPMQTNYFSDELYNDYPVNNIPPEGAELYCKWISSELNKNYENGKNTAFNDVRIPYRSEWFYAASTGGKDLPYPWGTSSVVNESNCFLANFNFKTYSGKKDSLCDKGNGNPDALTTAGYVLGRANYTARVDSYNPNNNGLYNMSGNVAELVYEENSRKPGTSGGGWMSSEEELKINGTDPFKGATKAHPNIGFRVVMTYLVTNE